MCTVLVKSDIYMHLSEETECVDICLLGVVIV